MNIDTAAVPRECFQLAQDLMLGRFLTAQVEAYGRTLYRFENGAVIWHKGAFAGLLVRDAYNGYRFVQLRKDWVALALTHRLGSFQGTDSVDSTTTYLFEYGAVRVAQDRVESVLARGTRLVGEQLLGPSSQGGGRVFVS